VHDTAPIIESTVEKLFSTWAPKLNVSFRSGRSNPIFGVFVSATVELLVRIGAVLSHVVYIGPQSGVVLWYMDVG